VLYETPELGELFAWFSRDLRFLKKEEVLWDYWYFEEEKRGKNMYRQQWPVYKQLWEELAGAAKISSQGTLGLVARAGGENANNAPQDSDAEKLYFVLEETTLRAFKLEKDFADGKPPTHAWKITALRSGLQEPLKLRLGVRGAEAELALDVAKNDSNFATKWWKTIARALERGNNLGLHLVSARCVPCSKWTTAF
jgi:hypothetical protein